MAGKWEGLSDGTYEIEDLGRPAVFLLPGKKLKRKIGGSTVEKDLHRFLSETFGAFTTTTIPYFGFWRNARQKTVYDKCRLYEVSFVGKERIPVLMSKLAGVARAVGEDCVYFKAGQYACLIHPKPLP